MAAAHSQLTEEQKTKRNLLDSARVDDASARYCNMTKDGKLMPSKNSYQGFLNQQATLAKINDSAIANAIDNDVITFDNQRDNTPPSNAPRRLPISYDANDPNEAMSFRFPSGIPELMLDYILDYSDEEYIFSFGECKIFFMPTTRDNKHYNTSNEKNLYLYLASRSDRVFYYTADSRTPYFLDGLRLSREFSYDQVECTDYNLMDVILKITSERGHTLPAVISNTKLQQFRLFGQSIHDLMLSESTQAADFLTKGEIKEYRGGRYREHSLNGINRARCHPILWHCKVEIKTPDGTSQKQTIKQIARESLHSVDLNKLENFWWIPIMKDAAGDIFKAIELTDINECESFVKWAYIYKSFRNKYKRVKSPEEVIAIVTAAFNNLPENKWQFILSYIFEYNWDLTKYQQKKALFAYLSPGVWNKINEGLKRHFRITDFFYDALRLGDLATVKTFILAIGISRFHQFIEPDNTSTMNDTAIHIAARNNHLALTLWLMMPNKNDSRDYRVSTAANCRGRNNQTVADIIEHNMNHNRRVTESWNYVSIPDYRDFLIDIELNIQAETADEKHPRESKLKEIEDKISSLSFRIAKAEHDREVADEKKRQLERGEEIANRMHQEYLQAKEADDLRRKKAAEEERKKIAVASTTSPVVQTKQPAKTVPSSISPADARKTRLDNFRKQMFEELGIKLPAANKHEQKEINQPAEKMQKQTPTQFVIRLRQSERDPDAIHDPQKALEERVRTGFIPPPEITIPQNNHSRFFKSALVVTTTAAVCDFVAPALGVALTFLSNNSGSR